MNSTLALIFGLGLGLGLETSGLGLGLEALGLGLGLGLDTPGLVNIRAYRLFSTCSKVPMTMHMMPLLQVHVCFILGKRILKFYYTVQHSILQKVQHFYHPTICISAVFTVARRQSLCSTVTLSVTFLCCIQTDEE